VHDIGGSQITFTSQASGVSLMEGQWYALDDALAAGTTPAEVKTVQVAWGDGSSNQWRSLQGGQGDGGQGGLEGNADGSVVVLVTGGHQYAEEGQYSVQVSATLMDGTRLTNQQLLGVADATLRPGSASTVLVQGEGDSTTVATFFDANVLASAAD